MLCILVTLGMLKNMIFSLISFCTTQVDIVFFIIFMKIPYVDSIYHFIYRLRWPLFFDLMLKTE